MAIDRNGEYVMDNPEWYGEADYGDGTYIERTYPYYENGSYQKECERQHDIESELIELGEERNGCTWYSVGVRERID